MTTSQVDNDKHLCKRKISNQCFSVLSARLSINEFLSDAFFFNLISTILQTFDVDESSLILLDLFTPTRHSCLVDILSHDRRCFASFSSLNSFSSLQSWPKRPRLRLHRPDPRITFILTISRPFKTIAVVLNRAQHRHHRIKIFFPYPRNSRRKPSKSSIASIKPSMNGWAS